LSPRRISLLLGTALLSVVLTGQAMAQAIQVSPNPLNFPGLQPIGSPLPGVLQVVISNPGTQALNITLATVTGDFVFGSDPPSQSLNFGLVGAGSKLGFLLLLQCHGGRTTHRHLTLVDNAPGSPQTFAISGTGFVGAMIQPRNDKMDLVTGTVGTPANGIEEIVSVGNQAVTITSVGISGAGFSQTNNCGAAMIQGQTCQINVAFNPPLAGPQTGAITITNTGAVNPVTIPLTGDAADLTMFVALQNPSATINAGEQAKYPLVIGGGFGAQLFPQFTFSCNGLPSGSMCSFTGGPLLPEGGLPVQVTISTTARSAALHQNLPGWEWRMAGVAAMVLIRRRRFGSTAIMVIGGLLLTGLVSCGGSSGASGGAGSTPAGTYNITISATRNGLTHTVPVTLVVR
jgi:hypothetical protein